MPKRYRALTLTDVVALSGMVPLICGTLILAMTANSRTAGVRVFCASNLRQIGLAIQMYANDNGGAFPRTLFDPDSPALDTTNRGWDSPVSFAPHGPNPVGINNVPASLYLAMKTQDLTSGVFICPSSDGQEDKFGGNPKGALGQSNFTSIAANLKYSYIVPFPTKTAVRKGFKLSFSIQSDFAIAADMNPGSAESLASNPRLPRAQMSRLNTNNHGGDGQNVVYADGHVEFQNSPFCGMQRLNGDRDNIYTAGGADTGASEVIEGQPTDDRDTILLPVDPAGPVHFRSASSFTLSAIAPWLGAAGGIIVLVIVLMLLMTRRSTIKHSDETSPMPPIHG